MTKLSPTQRAVLEKLAEEWQYSRSWRKHWIDDGYYFGTGKHPYLWTIVDCARYGFIHKREDGYDLYHKGKKFAHAKTVKELKIKVADYTISAAGRRALEKEK